MFFSRRSISLALLTVGALSLGLAACSGDDDDVASPTPTPYNPDICFIIWARQAGSLYDAYIWQAGASEVANGAGNYGFNTDAFDSVLGFFYFRTDATFENYQALGVTTAGNYTLTIDGLQKDDTFDFADTTNQLYFDGDTGGALGAQIASNGTGTFDGVLSDPDPDADITPGAGTLTVAHAGSNLAMTGLYALCVDSPSNLVPASQARPSAKVLEAARQALRDLR